MTRFHSLTIFALLSLLFGWPGAFAESDGARQLDRLFGRSTLQIATPDAKLHKIDVWIADTDARRTRGLMFVEKLADNAGMLFVYPRPQQLAMWMKNTPLSLDILFVRADGRVMHVVENTTPLSLDTIPSEAVVSAVIELKAGSAARMKIRPGAQVIHPAFKQG
jgi:uncharacterized protein